MTLRQTMARHARTTLTRLDHFGERVTRKRAGVADLVGVPCTIKRLGRRTAEQGFAVAFYRAEVFVPAGYDVKDGDVLAFAMQEGGVVSDNRIESSIASDSNGTLWEVTK